MPTRVVRAESTFMGEVCGRGRSRGKWPQKWWGRSAVETGPGGTGLRNGMDSHLGVLRKVPSVVHIQHWGEDDSKTIVV